MAETGEIIIKGPRTLQLNCAACHQALAYKVHSRIPSVRPSIIYHLVCLDVVTVRQPGLMKEKYMTLFTEAKHLEREAYFSTHKSGAAVHIKTYYIRVKVIGYTVVVLRLDGGKEYGGNELLRFAADNGIRLQVTPPHSSTKNGLAEVSNHIVCTTVRKMMIYANLPPALWPETSAAAVYLLNITPSQALHGKTPREMMDEALGRPVNPDKPSLRNLHAYGAITFTYNNAVERGSKFAARGVEGQLVGYEDSMYRVWLPSQHKVIRTADCTFVEEGDLVQPMGTVTETTDAEEWQFEDNTITQSGGDELDSTLIHTLETVPDDDTVETEEDESNADSELEEVEGALQPEPMPQIGRDIPPGREISIPGSLDVPIDKNLPRSSRSRTKTAKARALFTNSYDPREDHSEYGLLNMPTATQKAFQAAVEMNEPSEIVIPRTAKESQTLPEAPQWLAAMHVEIRALNRNQTWRKRPRDEAKTVLRGRWIFSVKRDADGKLSRFKARWVVRGFTQREGIDYNETYAAVAKPVSLRVLFAIVCEEDLECYQYDLIAAFLNALIGDHVIYVEEPHGFESSPPGTQSPTVCLLLKALYGLKQAPLLWYEEFTKFAHKHGYHSFLSDACIFRNKETGVIIVIYVDDVLVIARLVKSVHEAAELIGATFQMRALGEVHYYLGMRIIRDRAKRQLVLTQDGYIDKIAIKFNLPGKTSTVPLGKTMANGLKGAVEGYTATNRVKTEYQTMVGSAVWPSCISRPDCCYEVGLLYRFLKNPTDDHMQAVRHLLDYMVTTKTRGLLFQGGGDMRLRSYTDASWADDTDTRRSTGGMVFKLAGAPVVFKSGRQTIVTLSSTEAEYVQLTLAAKEANAIAKLLDELGEFYTAVVRPVTIYKDNQPAIDITNRTKTSSDGRTKHIDTRFRYIQQELAAGNVVIEWVPTHEQAADGLTKALDKVKHAEFVQQLGLVDCKTQIEMQKHTLAMLDGDKPVY